MCAGERAMEHRRIPACVARKNASDSVNRLRRVYAMTEIMGSIRQMEQSIITKRSNIVV